MSSSIKEIVCNLVKKYKTNDPFEIASQREVIILFVTLKGVLGFHNTFNRIHAIHISNELDETMQRFVCAHELGHAILHPKINTPFLRRNTFQSIDRIEIEANSFAVELLLPDETIKDYWNTNMTIYDAAKISGIPAELVHLKRY